MDIYRGGVCSKPAISREGGSPCQGTPGKEEKKLARNIPGIQRFVVDWG